MTTGAHRERPRLDGLGRALMESGALPPEWAPAYAAVPRSDVLPDLVWPYDMETGRSVAVSRTDDPEAWERSARADVPIVTQWDDGDHPGREPGLIPTSSVSMPSVVFRMLRDLGVQPGDNVLEIGTASGWNALLMAHRAGPWRVRTVEVDERLARAAEATVERLGAPVHVVHGDGLQGYPVGGPYERIIATCGLREVPFAWIEQGMPGTVIVAPWGTDFSNADAVVRLGVAPGADSASGRFTGPVEFMKLRAHRLPPVVHVDYVPGSVADGDETSTTVTEAEFLPTHRFDAKTFALGLRVPRCRHHVTEKDEDGDRAVWFYGGEGDRSWACVQFREGRTTRVWQSGRRRLWDEVEAALGWWHDHGRPEHARFGLTVNEGGQRAWLDDPAASWTIRR